jgi:hypothetical protein
MGSHGKKVEIDVSKGYEKNEIQLRGIIVTVIALFLTCVVSFWLMYVLQNEMERYWADSEKQNASPMSLDSKDKLPPEPRLQSAPGFGVDSPKGRINLELKHPQAEWEELQKIWNKEAEEGQKVVANGQETIVTLPIEAAKKRLLEEGVKTVAPEQGKAAFEEAKAYTSEASAGRKSAKMH